MLKDELRMEKRLLPPVLVLEELQPTELTSLRIWAKKIGVLMTPIFIKSLFADIIYCTTARPLASLLPSTSLTSIK